MKSYQLIITQRNIPQEINPVWKAMSGHIAYKAPSSCHENSTDVEGRIEGDLLSCAHTFCRDQYRWLKNEAIYREGRAEGKTSMVCEVSAVCSLHNWTYEKKKLMVESETHEPIRFPIWWSEIIPRFHWRLADDMMCKFEGETCKDFMQFVLVTAMCSQVEGSGLEVEAERL